VIIRSIYAFGFFWTKPKEKVIKTARLKITDSAGYVVESSVLSTNNSYNYVLFVLLAVLIVAVIGTLAFVLHRRVVKEPRYSEPK
jgi:hypothetical protein